MTTFSEAARDAYESRTGDTEPEELGCPRCGETWIAPTRWGDVVVSVHCPSCGERGEPR